MEQLQHDQIRVGDVVRLRDIDWWRVTQIIVRPNETGLMTVWVPKPGYQEDDGMPGYLCGPADQLQWVIRPR